MGLLLIIWLSTAFIQIPCHAKLAVDFSTASHVRLVRSNWLRTVAWSLRAGLTLYACMLCFLS